MLHFSFNLDYVRAKFAHTHFTYFVDIFINSHIPTHIHKHISLITQNQDKQMKKLAWRKLR